MHVHINKRILEPNFHHVMYTHHSNVGVFFLYDDYMSFILNIVETSGNISTFI